MEEGRTYVLQRKPRILLDKRFPAVQGLELGDTGQAVFKIVIDAERLEMQPDNVERIVKTVAIDDVQLINNKRTRII